MSTIGGPKLAGIGPGAASDLVVCLDAHDAGSYGGEATTNLFPQPSLADSAVGSTWSGTNGSWGTSTATVESVMGPDGKYIKAVSNQHTASGGGTAHIWFFYSYLSGMGSAQRNLTLTNGTTYTCSWWWKANEAKQHSSSNQIYFTSPSVSTSGALNPVSTEWSKAFITFTFGGTTGTYNPGHYFYGCGDSTAVGFKVWYAMLQIEEKAYGTPAVRSQLSGFAQQGYNARPVSVDLYVNDSFSDKSPNRLPVTNGWSGATMPGFGGKFGGNALYFNGNSYLQYDIGPSGSPGFFGAANYTIDFWHYMPAGTSLRNYATWISTYTNTLNDGIIIAQYITSGTYGVWTDGTGWLNTGVSILADQWAHVAVVREGTGSNECTYYLNGTAIMTFTDVRDYTYTQIREFTVGALYDASNSHALEGYMSDVRVCSGTALWTHPFTPPTRSGDNAPVVDLSGSDNGGNFVTKDMTDVKTYQRGQVIEPVASAVWDFDGTDDTISLGGATAAASARPLNAYPFTFTAWVTSDTGWSPASGMDELLNMNIAGQRVSLGAYVATPTGPSIMYGGSNHWSCASSAFGNPTGWTHIAYVIYGSNNSNHKIYINGVSQTLTNNGGAHGGTAGWTLGANSASGEYWFGNIANAQLYNKTLTEAEVKQSFNAQCNRFKVGPPTVVRSGLMGYWDAGKVASYSGSGSTWYDISGNGNNATLSGLTFNSGSGGYFKPTVTTTGSATTPSFANTATMTMECWYKSSSGDSFTTYGRIMDRGDTTISLGTYGTYQLRSWVYAGGGRTSPENVKNGIGQDGLWHHIGYTFDGSTARFYFDGTYVNYASRSGALESPYALTLFTGDGYGFGGQIAVARYYSTVLSAAQISNNFQADRARFGV